MQIIIELKDKMVSVTYDDEMLALPPAEIMDVIEDAVIQLKAGSDQFYELIEY
jgi:hypothetical protein